MKRILLIVMLLALTLPVMAQDATPEVTPDPALGSAPPAVQTALAQLNEQLGTSLTLSDLNWSWREEAFGDTSLGCPQPDMMYAQVVTRGYVITFDYGGSTYDYRAATDGSNLFLCTGQEAPAGVTPEATQAVTGSVFTAANAANITEFSRLNTEVGTTALADWSADGSVIIAVSSEENNGVYVYNQSDPDAEARFYETQGAVTALDTVRINGITYLAVAGGTISYFPIVPPGMDVVLMQDENIDTVQSIDSLALSPDGSLLAAASESANGLALWNTSTGGLFTPIELESAVTAVAFAPAATFPALPATEEPDATPEATAEATVDAAALESSSFLLAVGTDDGTITLYEINLTLSADSRSVNYRVVSTLSGHEDAVRDLAFNAGGTLLASGSMDGTARLWNTNLQEPTFGDNVAVLNGSTVGDDSGTSAVLSVAFSPDGTLLATAGENPQGDTAGTAIQLWDVTVPASATRAATLLGHEATIGSVDFSTDGSLLMSASEDGSIRLWGAGQ